MRSGVQEKGGVIPPAKDRIRNIIPRWRGFRQASSLGELSAAPKRLAQPRGALPKHAFSRNLEAWRAKPNLETAAELVLAASVVGERGPEILDAAHSLTAESSTAVGALREVAQHLLQSPSQVPEVARVALPKQRAFVYAEPRNALAWADLALSYATLGNLKKSERAVRTAYQLAPNSRHILRVAACFFSHIGDAKRANELLNRSPATSHDPWLSAAEVATASEAKIHSKQIKSARDKLLREDFRPKDIAELASAVAMSELSTGNASRSKKLFRLSLGDPNENAVAQAEWAVQNKHVSIEISDENRSRPRAYEAGAINSYKARDWTKCVYSLNLWHLDQPFHAHPSIVGSSIAGDIMGDDKLALSFATSGLESNPTNPTLYNNAAVSLARLGQVEKAEKFLAHAYAFTHPDDVSTRIILTATKGLIEFRKKRDVSGRSFYEAALISALEAKLPRLGIRAYLYLVQEEAFFDPLQAKSALEVLDNLSVHMKHDDTKEALKLTTARLTALANAVGVNATYAVGSYPCIRLEQVYLPKLATTA